VTKALQALIREVGGRDSQAGTAPAARPPTLLPGQAETHVPILGENVFRDALARERKRSDRFGAPFAVLIVDRSDGTAEDGPWVAVVGALAAVKRDSDAVGWLDQGAVLGLLLPDVSRNGAIKVLDRLRREIALEIGAGALAAVSMRLYAHGVEPGPDGAPFPPVSLLLEAFVPRQDRPWRDAAKRGLDIVGSSVLLAVFAPVMLAVVAAVKLTSPGPAVHRQVRVGRRGDMSLVGPRPPIPFEVEQYQPWHRRRVLEAKPGITGLWQVSGRSRTTFDEMVRLDLRYARTHTLWTDIKILAATPRAMFKGAI